jgi:hypothetical protein
VGKQWATEVVLLRKLGKMRFVKNKLNTFEKFNRMIMKVIFINTRSIYTSCSHSVDVFSYMSFVYMSCKNVTL